MKAIVSVIMGSTSDLPVMKKATDFLNEMKVPFEVNALSAHRTPEAVEAFSKGAKDGSVKIGLGDPSLKGIETLRTKRNLIIVDDIERIEKNLSIDEVFGFFQDIIVDSDTKVIFVGNEDKIESEISKHSYASIKEKTIGQEFLIQSNPNDAIEVFIKEMTDRYTNLSADEIRNIVNNVLERTMKKIVSLILALTILVIVHEFGHFIFRTYAV